jgi:hypothetical protein
MLRYGAGLAMPPIEGCRCRLRLRDAATPPAQLRTQNEGVTVFFIALV